MSILHQILSIGILLSVVPGIWAWWPTKNPTTTLLLLFLMLGIVGIGWGNPNNAPFFLFFYLSALTWIGLAQFNRGLNRPKHLFLSLGTLSLLFFHLFQQFQFPGTRIVLALSGLCFIAGLLLLIPGIFNSEMPVKPKTCRNRNEYDCLLAVPATETLFLCLVYFL